MVVIDQDDGVGCLFVGNIENGAVSLLESLYVVEDNIFHFFMRYFP